MKTERGDWVRFYRDGELVIGVVQYIIPHSGFYSLYDQIMTDNGSISEDAILETRKEPEE